MLEMKEKYIKRSGVCCLNESCESYDIQGGSVTVTGGGATQDVHCLKCGSSWTDYYKLDTAVGIEISNDHIPTEVS